MQRRLDLFDKIAYKSLVLAVFYSVLIPATAFAVDLPANPDLVEAPGPTPDTNPVRFAPVARLCKCASPRVKTGILLLGITSLCYSALCAKDKPLIVACSSLATYAATKLNE